MTDDLSAFRRAEAALWDSVGVTPAERFVELPTGGRVRVQELGEGPPVLFLHGVTVAGTSWYRLATALDGVRCILLDRPGCGLSDPLPPGSLRDLDAVLAYADDLIANVLDALELPTAHLASTSYGGLFALRGAARHPNRINRIVQYSWLIGAPVEKVPVSMRLAALPGMRALSARMPITPRLVRSMLSQVGLERAINSGAFTEADLLWTVTLLRDTTTLTNDMRNSPEVVTPIRGVNKAVLLSDDTLRQITMPTLFLWGDEDPMGGRTVAEGFAARLPNARVEIVEQAGHAPWLDELDYCAAQTTNFFDA